MTFSPAFHNDPTIKEKMLKSAIAHRRSDTFVQGQFFKDGVGCHLGCAVMSITGIRDEWHEQFADIANCHPRLSHLQEFFFENLPINKARLWSESIIDAMPVGADINRGYWSFMSWMLLDRQYGVIGFTSNNQIRNTIQSIGLLCGRAKHGDVASSDGWSEALQAASLAGRNALWAAGAFRAASLSLREASWSEEADRASARASRAAQAAEAAGRTAEAARTAARTASQAAVWAAEEFGGVRAAEAFGGAGAAEAGAAARAAARAAGEAGEADHIERMAEQLIVEMANSPMSDTEERQPLRELPKPAIREVELV